MNLKIIDTRTGERVTVAQLHNAVARRIGFQRLAEYGGLYVGLRENHDLLTIGGLILTVRTTDKGELVDIDVNKHYHLEEDMPPLRDRWQAVLAPIKPVVAQWDSECQAQVTAMVEELTEAGDPCLAVAAGNGWVPDGTKRGYIVLYFSTPGVSVRVWEDGQSAMFGPVNGEYWGEPFQVVGAVKAMLCAEVENGD